MNPALQSAFVRKPSRMGPFLLGSLGGHVALFGSILLFSYFKLTPDVNLDQKPIHAELVKLGKPRDQKLLPTKDQLPPPPQEVKAPPSQKEDVVPEKTTPIPVPNVKPQETKAQTGDKSSQSKKSLFGAFDKLGKAPKPDDSTGQENGDVNGTSSEAIGDQYAALITSQIRREYNVSDTISEQERMYLKAQVLVKISRTGEITFSKLIAPSQNDLFNDAVLAAVKKVGHLSPPPAEFQEEFASKGVVLQFTP
ncbi:MAG: TonB C-terminal domain-containing protein [Myxococcaceae bacterium]